MIGWTKRVLATAWVMSASLGCAGATPKASTPDYVRSPPLDYADGPRSASDGEVMGAHQRPVQDWIAGNPTNGHMAPGWSMRYGEPHFTLEHTHAGHGASSSAALHQALACPPTNAPLAPEDAEANVALRRAWLESTLGPPPPSHPELAGAIAELSQERSRFLSCDTR